MAVDLSTLLGPLFKLIDWLAAKLKRTQARGSESSGYPPKKTLIVLPCSPSHCLHWSMGAYANQPANHIVGDFSLTNVSGEPVKVVQVLYLHGYLWRKRRTEAVLSIEGPKPPYGQYDLFAHSRADGFVFGGFCPPIETNEGKDIVLRAVVFTDQFGNNHRLKRVRFKAPPRAI